MDVQIELWGEGAGLSSAGEQTRIVFELIWKNIQNKTVISVLLKKVPLKSPHLASDQTQTENSYTEKKKKKSAALKRHPSHFTRPPPPSSSQ